MEKVIICCAAGKSGGHIIPNLTWARKQYPNAPLLFFSANTPLDHQLLRNSVDWHMPLALKAPAWYAAPLFIVQSVWAMLTSFYYLFKHKPKKILSTGGITALPVCIAAFCLRIPIELFELNATPGSAIRWLAPLATKINVCFASAKIYFDEKKVTMAEYPMRFDSKSSEDKIFDDSHKKTIFIQGGSQGSVSLNKKVKQYIQDNPEICSQIQIIHQTGTFDSFDWQKFYYEKNIPAIVFPFTDNIAPYYQGADLVICRAGAGQLFETLHFKKQCIVIPLELPGNMHQLENAMAMQKEYPEFFRVVRQATPLNLANC